MADRPLSAPLPADLPEDWTDGQIVAPSGASVGLSEQHGYNYLMEAVNRTQEAVNAINESFEDVSGRRTCRVVVGTSTAGWTQADCDYLCDGTDDQEELDAAVEAVRAKGGGEIAILGGTYHLSTSWSVGSNKNENMSFAFSGEPGSTVLELARGCGFSRGKIYVSGITFSGAGGACDIFLQSVEMSIEGCRFLNIFIEEHSFEDGYALSVLFRGNEMEFTMETIAPLFTSVGDYSNLLMAGNVFRVKAASGNQMHIVNIENFNSVFAQNYIICDDTGGAHGRYLDVGGLAVNNVIKNVSIRVNGDKNCVGNNIENGDIIVRSNLTAVCGNIVKDGSIHAVSFATVSGNVVAAKTDTPAITLRAEDRVSFITERTPCVTGNIILSGSVGVYLQNMSSLAEGPVKKKALVSGNRISGCATSIQIESDWSQCMITGNMLDSSVVDGGTGNIVRLNSDDAGGGGGGTAGVSSFNGRAGAVVPASGDYTAAMVGSIPSGDVTTIKAVTQAQYDALATKDPKMLYLIRG